MNEVYQKLIDRTRTPLDLKQVKTIFGFAPRPHKIAKRGRTADQVVKAVEAQSYDLTVFRVKWRNLTLKIYDKGGRVLRIEVVTTMSRICAAARYWTSYLSCSNACARCSSGSSVRCKLRTLRS